MGQDFAKQLEAILYQILPLVKTIGVRVEEARPGYAKTSMSRSPVVVNHINAFHAGALYTFAETAAAAVIAATFDLSKVTIINKRGEIKYHKLVTEKVVSENTFSKNEIDRINNEVETNGKTVFQSEVFLKNPDKEIAAQVVFDFYMRKIGG